MWFVPTAMQIPKQHSALLVQICPPYGLSQHLPLPALPQRLLQH